MIQTRAKHFVNLLCQYNDSLRCLFLSRKVDLKNKRSLNVSCLPYFDLLVPIGHFSSDGGWERCYTSAPARLEPISVPSRAHFDQLSVPRTSLPFSPASLLPDASFHSQPAPASLAANTNLSPECKSVKPLSQVTALSCHLLFFVCFASCWPLNMGLAGLLQSWLRGNTFFQRFLLGKDIWWHGCFRGKGTEDSYLAVCFLVNFVSPREGISKRDSRNQAQELEEDSRTPAEQFWGVLEGNVDTKTVFWVQGRWSPIVESLMNMYKWFNMRHTTLDAYSPSQNHRIV